MSLKHEFPVILVSAENKILANTIISDIIDNEPTESEISNESTCCRVWRITNKYYTAYVHLHPVVDGEDMDIDMGSVQAHVIYLSENECEERFAERRLVSLRGDVTRLALAACSEAGGSLAAWAAHHRYELVPLLEPPPAPASSATGPFPDLPPLPRARAALHAQRWHAPRSATPRYTDGVAEESSDGGEYESSEEEEDESVAVERMEEFCSMLGAVGGGGLEGLDREDRLRRAEDLVAALCRAMGHHAGRW